MKAKCYSVIAILGAICLNSITANAYKPIKKSRKGYHHFISPGSVPATKIRDVRFAFNKDEVRSPYYPELDHIVRLMKSNNSSIKVSGYADNKGGYVYNWKLSE